jgi:hypothetical protein
LRRQRRLAVGANMIRTQHRYDAFAEAWDAGAGSHAR